MAHLQDKLLKFNDFINSDSLIHTYLGTKTDVYLSYNVNSHCPIGPSGGCGTCPLSHFTYDTQLRLKEAYLLYLLDFINSHLNADINPSINVVPAPVPEHYRNKMEYTIGFDGSIGLRAKGKWWKVLHKHTCFLAHPKIEDLFYRFVEIIPMMQLPYYDRKKHTGLLRLLTIRITNTNQIGVKLTISDPQIRQYKSPYSLEEIRRIITKYTKHLPIDSFYLQLSDRIADVAHGESILLYGNPFIIEEFVLNNKKLRFAVTPDTFFQVNTYLTKAYLQLANEWFESIASSQNKHTPVELFDLYGGIGFFGLTLVKLYNNSIKKLTVVEENPQSIRAGLESARLMEILTDTLMFQNAKVEKIVDTLDISNDIAIIDPARNGLHPKVIKILTKKPFKRLLYVSCNPRRFAEEFTFLGLSHSYRIEKVILLDNFPNTLHLETFFFLKRR